MSRSYKNPNVSKCKLGPRLMRFYKRLASKAVRRAVEVTNGSTYRRLYNTWRLCDRRSWDNEDLIELGLVRVRPLNRK